MHGSHAILAKPGWREILSIPQRAEVKRGLLRKAIRVAGLSVQEFVDLL
jgi:predicted RNA binding protein YcfA (HicA-like mRNA interferase family)